MADNAPSGRHLSWSSFAVDVAPRCMWGVELSEQNQRFLEGIDPRFFTYSVEAHLAALEGPSRQHAAMAIRLVYGHAVETLFALLGAAVQAPNCPLGWMLSYTGGQLYTVVRKISGDEEGGMLPAREGSLAGWDQLSRRIHLFRHADPTEDERIKVLFATTWAQLATEFLDPLSGEEYNSIKHGSRARAGGSSLTMSHPGSAEPFLASHSEFGARYFHPVKLGDRVNFYAQDAMRNWSPVALVVRIELIATSIRNVISYLRAYLGISETGQVTFEWPEATPELELAWKTDFIVQSGAGGYLLELKDIEPLSASHVLDAYK